MARARGLCYDSYPRDSIPESRGTVGYKQNRLFTKIGGEMSSKYYAVKVGRETGIFRTW